MLCSSKLYGIWFILLQERGAAVTKYQCLCGDLLQFNIHKASWHHYSSLQMEFISIFWAVFDCTYYIYRSSKATTLVTDHKPLVRAYIKPMEENSARILKLKLDLMQFILGIVCTTGKRHAFAETLSRAPIFNS